MESNMETKLQNQQKLIIKTNIKSGPEIVATRH